MKTLDKAQAYPKGEVVFGFSINRLESIETAFFLFPLLPNFMSHVFPLETLKHYFRTLLLFPPSSELVLPNTRAHVLGF